MKTKTVVKKRRTFSFTSASIGTLKSRRPVARKLASARRMFSAALGAYLLAAGFSDAQIEVNAYVTDASINFNTGTVNPGNVHIINTATNQIVGSPIPVGFLPIGVSVSPDGRYAYISNNAGSTISIIDTVPVRWSVRLRTDRPDRPGDHPRRQTSLCDQPRVDF
jgi:DNA-binding beta-propeller fold protein YncE